MIRIGDILLYKDKGFLARSIRFFTRSKYNHASVVVRKYSDHSFKIIESRLSFGVKYSKIHKDEIYEAVRHKNCPGISANDFEEICQPFIGKKLSCSELVAEIFMIFLLMFQDDMPTEDITPENIGSSKYTFGVDF